MLSEKEVRQEYERLNKAVTEAKPGKKHVALYCAQQSLAWILGYGMSPHKMIADGPDYQWFAEEVKAAKPKLDLPNGR